MDRWAGDFGCDGPGYLATTGETDEVGVHEAGREGVGVAADDGESFVVEDRPPEAFIHQSVDGVAVDFVLSAACVTESFWIDRHTVSGEGSVREPLGDVPVVLDEPVGSTAAGLVEQVPEFVAVFRMSSAGECQGVVPVTIDARCSCQRIESRTVGAISG